MFFLLPAEPGVDDVENVARGSDLSFGFVGIHFKSSGQFKNSADLGGFDFADAVHRSELCHSGAAESGKRIFGKETLTDLKDIFLPRSRAENDGRQLCV